ncbi:enoyl-CoA delta isomerase 1, mitochondrial-like [Culex pipiens pallens]|uniref:enoyl-CoA delta isomerase 1, mitochondrial-like n=1 Tax=Culex pipiens pallens TaxID=42434 RepID=UPI0022AB2BA1|nr:enoyl-CoA delta isomerase 1, mitochondrial-like [Culex pipiens pallens]XP_052563176.1 enoyl-CoA delta isomerase 1, mitochondrial-like [Culex pipiens pallens]
MLRPTPYSTLLSRALRRSFSSAANNGPVVTEMDPKTGYATVTLNRAPVNAMNLELMRAIQRTIDDLERDKARGMILTSKFSNKVFCAGLELTEMVNPNPEQFRVFWTSLQDTWMKLYGTSFPTVAVINGHAPAGGCMISLACEYRVMQPNFSIGLNETVLGLPVPRWLQTTMSKVIGERMSEIACTTGKLYSAEQALKMGMIDELVMNQDEGVLKAVAFLDSFKDMIPVVRDKTKLELRKLNIEDFQNYRQAELDFVTKHVTSSEFQNVLLGYLQSLKDRKSK